MALKDKINELIKDAMRAKDQVRLDTLRSVKSALLEKEISIRQGGVAELSEAEEMAVLNNLGKKRKDSIEQFTNAGRTELAAKEAKELEILMEFLPKQLTEAEVKARVAELVAETGAQSMKDLGKVMPQAMKEFKGRADGKLVQDLLKSLLEG
ncbi:MAG: GatB/YqeY domain-containing protein [Bacteroidetes bacterium]|nr:GatB/YqeY domain-containing protein [Bacteroidota bacterium]